MIDRFRMHHVLAVLLLAPILGCGSPLIVLQVNAPEQIEVMGSLEPEQL